MTTILVVDDSELINNLLHETLTSQGYNVMQAHDATRAYKMIQQQQLPDLILLDIVLPDASGLQLCQAFRNHPPTRNIPIILVTGTASSTAEKVKGLRAGADDYVIKPFEMDELLERIRAVLRRTEHRPAAPPPSGSRPADQPSPSHEKKPNAPTLTVSAVLSRAIFSPVSLRQELPSVSLLFVTAMIVLLSAGLLAAPGTPVKPVMACLLGALLWGFLVSVLVVTCSLVGMGLKWKEGANLFSLAALPILIKLAGAAAFSAWTTLSPFYFTGSPLLFFPKLTPWMSRLDVYEIWAVVLLALLLRKRPGASVVKVALVTLCVWILAAGAAAGLLHLGGAS